LARELRLLSPLSAALALDVAWRRSSTRNAQKLGLVIACVL
jgi:hypothetical protein